MITTKPEREAHIRSLVQKVELKTRLSRKLQELSRDKKTKSITLARLIEAIEKIEQGKKV